MTTPIKISDEAMEAAIAAAAGEYVEWRRMPNREAYVNLLANNAARRAVEAAAPLIAAQVLRGAAEGLREQAYTVRTRDGLGDALLAAGIDIAAHRVEYGTSLTEEAR